MLIQLEQAKRFIFLEYFIMAEAETVLKKLLASGMTADEILEKLK